MISRTKILTKGAEAVISQGVFLGKDVIFKHRVKKTYRLPYIDSKVRIHRLKAEAKILSHAWRLGIKVPSLLGIDYDNNILIIELIQGEPLFSFMKNKDPDFLRSTFHLIGSQVGILHQYDIIHGDLTVFNIIMDVQLEPWLIDFGLAQISNEVERKADDILTFYSTLGAIFSANKILFESFIKGYFESYKDGQKTLEQMKRIQSRARYIAREDRID
ncbi:MAG: KEOPS complex kinase/ATPase Bud32 [Candidatus Hodarchaeales archaeon]